MVEYNIIATAGTSEVELAPYPDGNAQVPEGRVRKIYVMVISNSSPSANNLTLRIYRGGNVERSLTITVGAYGTVAVSCRAKPVLVVPSGRALKAVASAESVSILMTAEDE